MCRFGQRPDTTWLGVGGLFHSAGDVSVTGAAKELSDPCGIPDSFLLVIPDDGLGLPCRIVRRGGYLIGVAFD